MDGAEEAGAEKARESGRPTLVPCTRRDRSECQASAKRGDPGRRAALGPRAASRGGVRQGLRESLPVPLACHVLYVAGDGGSTAARQDPARGWTAGVTSKRIH